MTKNNWVYDIETLSDCFLVVFEHYKTEETKWFFISTLYDNRKELKEYLDLCKKNKEWLISFNGLSFDSQVLLGFFYNRYKDLEKYTGLEVGRILYNIAQETIEISNRKEFPKYKEWELPFKQLDVFKLNHWDNPAKSSSLKWIQYGMDWYNVQEMPINHTESITTEEQHEIILDYCKNDVKSTKKILEKSSEQIALRNDLSKEYNLNLYSASEPRIAKELFLHFLSKELNVEKKEIKVLRTPRESIIVKDIILDYIRFKSPEFSSVLNFFNKTIIRETKGSTSFSINHKGMKTDYGLGGIHGARKGIFKTGGGYVIKTADVVSFYPNLAIQNFWSPEHLPNSIFCKLYNWFFEERKKLPKSNPLNYVYKLILNSTYGLSIDKNSFLYDPQFGMRITVNGQLSLSMLYENISLNIPGSIPLMQNTDGLEFMIPVEYVEKYNKICADWEKLTKLSLEHDEYSKMIIFDVNNYIAISNNGKVKSKGRFEWEDLEKQKVATLHKNKSFLVIPKAIYQYFVNNIKPSDFIETNKNIFDYCGAVKAKGKDWSLRADYIDGHTKIQETQQKLVRYYVSESGVLLTKNHTDGRSLKIDAGGWLQTIFNKADQKEWVDYKINKEYYLENIYKEIYDIKELDSNLILAKPVYTQTNLFN